MWNEIWKKYGKMVAAAVFLTVAGLCYGFSGSQGTGETVRLPEETSAVQESLLPEGTAQEETAEVESISMCFVHICGEVEAPGVYELPEGSRIFEAVELAGGFTEEASQSSLNLAGMISDGMQIVILSKEEATAARLEEANADAGRLNINKASKEQLMALPGIGASRAEEIIRYREQAGGFQTIEEIMKVSGIKDAAFQKIKDSITV